MNETTKNLLYASIGVGIAFTSAIFIAKYLSVRAKSVRLANEEWQKWGKTTLDENNKVIVSGGKEYEQGYVDKVGDYWNDINYSYDGNDRDVAWSSAFISSIMKRAGAKSNFKYSASHSEYIRDSIQNRLQGLKKGFIGYRISEKPLKVGDLICYSREDMADMYNVTTPYKSHCDIVVKVNKGSVEVIGGNVNQSVSKKILKTDSDGYLVDKNYKWFALIKNTL